jgi:hypothetical protein
MLTQQIVVSPEFTLGFRSAYRHLQVRVDTSVRPYKKHLISREAAD